MPTEPGQRLPPAAGCTGEKGIASQRVRRDRVQAAARARGHARREYKGGPECHALLQPAFRHLRRPGDVRH